MVDKPDYNVGTVSVTSGTKTITGVGTFWLSAALQPGDLFGFDGYPMARIASTPLANGTLTLLDNWRGPTLAAGSPYFIRFQPEGSRLTSETVALRQMLSQDNLIALAGLVLSANKLPYATGANTMSLADLTVAGRALINLTGTAANGKIAVMTGAAAAAVRDIVGTVSQSGGIPTGAIVESGANANGNYVRYADGTQLTYGLQSINGTVAPGTSIGPGLTQPAVFVGASKTFTQAAYYTAVNGGGTPIYAVQFGSVFQNNSGITGVQYLNQGNTQGSSFPTFSIGSLVAASLLVNYVTIGRWF